MEAAVQRYGDGKAIAGVLSQGKLAESGTYDELMDFCFAFGGALSASSNLRLAWN